MNIQERINSLQPYVIQIRFNDGTPIVDVVFTLGWKVLPSKVIGSMEGEDKSINYYMFYTEKEGLGIDDVFDYIENVINMNIEREKKYELLKQKTGELKEVFRNNSLSKLENMKFVLGSESLIPDVMPKEFDDIDIADVDSIKVETKPVEEKIKPTKPTKPTKPAKAKKVEVVNGNNLDGASNVKAELREGQEIKVKNQKVELPPKVPIEVVNFEEPDMVCKCGPGDVCPVCIEEQVL